MRVLLLALVHACSALRISRRTAFGAGAASALGRSLPASAATKPVVVLGANGGTGLECVKYLASKGISCVAATRSGDFVGDASSKLVSVARGDVTDPPSLASLITRTTGAVIYAASASRSKEAKKSSNAKAVDRDGLVDVAKLCIANDVPRLVVVSSGGVSKPSSAVYIFLNLAAGGIMDAKIAGEDALRRLYAAPGVAERGVGYTVVRPGGLLRDAGLGVSAVELNQGHLNRADLLSTNRGDAAAATWKFRGDGSRRRRGRDVEIPCRRVAATPRLRRGIL